MSILFIIIGVILVIVNANAWVVIPEFLIWLSFGFAAAGFIIQIIVAATVGSKTKKAFKDFDKAFDNDFFKRH